MKKLNKTHRERIGSALSLRKIEWNGKKNWLKSNIIQKVTSVKHNQYKTG